MADVAVDDGRGQLDLDAKNLALATFEDEVYLVLAVTRSEVADICARGLRGSWLDPFRFGPEKAVDRSLLANYEADLDLIAEGRGNPEEARRLAAWPAAVRGFGPVREAALKNATVTREGARAALMA